MICPKCEFSQPDDIYCALCGVHIERYAQKKRKRFHKVGLGAFLLCIATITIASFLTSSPKNELPDTNRQTPSGKTIVASSQKNSLSRTTLQNKPPARSRDDRGARDKSSATAEPSSEPSFPRNEQRSQAEDEGNKGLQTAKDWFEKGKGLDDDSEAEVQCYEKARELDPQFAPAAFRLGAIHYRQARHELADQEFSSFLQHASDEDKATYDIYEFYSLGEVERLSESMTELSPDEEEETEVQPKSETEAGQESFGEEPGEETSEEAGQETSEEVMTVVRFSQVNGHIVVPVVLNHSLDARVLVDTGAGITILSTELAEELGLEEEPGKSITLKTMAMDVQAQLVRLDAIQVGGLTRNNFQVAVTDLPIGEEGKFQGILGMDFMNNYSVHIDNEGHRLILTTKAP